MRNIIFSILLIMLLPISSFCQSSKSTVASVIQQLDTKKDTYGDIAHQIWEWAELGYLEVKSSQLLQDHLQKEGFQITKNAADIPTAFIAEYGSGKPIIGILAEFDALPGISQQAIPEKAPVVEGGSGHACGHHLFGAGSVAAAVAVKNWLKETKTKGTVRLYGTPAEEGGAGKVYMVRGGLFDDADAVLHWHPGSGNGASASSSLSNKSAKFKFYGQAAHAAASPERGRSSLDAVEAMNFMVNMQREHVPSASRTHYVITRGGEAPNVVPAYAEVYYYVRHPDMAQVKANFEWVVKAAEGAALGTGTRMEYEVMHGLYNVMPNEPLAELMYKNLKIVGGVKYNAEERAFAEKIIPTLGKEGLKPEDAEKILPYSVNYTGTGGSTDVGDISWVVPTAGLRTATWVPGTGAHSWQAVAAGGTSIGTKGMMVAAKTITLTAIDIYQNPKVCDTAKAALSEKRGKGFIYEPLLGDRKPPLDYRK